MQGPTWTQRPGSPLILQQNIRNPPSQEKPRWLFQHVLWVPRPPPATVPVLVAFGLCPVHSAKQHSDLDTD